MKKRIKEFLINNQKIRVLGDTRFDQIKYRKNNNDGNILITKEIKKTKNILFGSIEEQDINIIFDSLNKLHPNLNNNNINLIFVPHEPEENILINLESNLKELDIRSTRYSSNMKNQSSNINLIGSQALLIDTTGILADLYKYSVLSYIGCGFGKGVHNVAEPAIYGNTICFGPNYHILNEAVEMIQKDIAYSIKNSEELTNVLSIIFDDIKLKDNSVKTSEYINTKFNLTKRIIDEIFY